MPTPSELLHQSFLAFPKLDAAFVDPTTGLISEPWYFFLARLWQLLGGSTLDFQNAVVLSSTTLNDMLAKLASTGQPVGSVVVTGGLAAEELQRETLALVGPPDSAPPSELLLGMALAGPGDSQVPPDPLGSLVLASMEAIAL